MARQNTNRSIPIRSHQKFEELVKEVQAKNLKDKRRFVRSSRITLAIHNQYTKYPQLMKELLDADLK